MPLPVIVDTYRVAIHYATNDGAQTAENVIHLADAVSWPSRGAHVAEAVENALTAAHVAFSDVLACMSDSAAIVGCSVTPLDGATVTTERAFVLSGSAAGQFVPAASVITTHYTLERGRRHRGRTYCPFISEGTIEDGHLSAGGNRASVEAGWNLFRTHLAADVDPVVFEVASYADVEGFAVDHSLTRQILGTQRRRQSRLRI